MESATLNTLTNNINSAATTDLLNSFTTDAMNLVKARDLSFDDYATLQEMANSHNSFLANTNTPGWVDSEFATQ